MEENIEKENKHKKKNIISALKTIALIASIILISGILYSVTGGYVKPNIKQKQQVQKSKTWPNNEYTKFLTKPSFGNIEVEYLQNNIQIIKIVNVKYEDVLNYIELNKNNFVKSNILKNETFYKYVSSNSKYKLTVQYDTEKMIIFIEKL